MKPQKDNPPSQKRSLREIARDVRKTWPKPYFAAQPYLEALGELDSADEMFYHDTGHSIIRGFLANAQTFRGPEARQLKEELQQHLRKD